MQLNVSYSFCEITTFCETLNVGCGLPQIASYQATVLGSQARMAHSGECERGIPGPEAHMYLGLQPQCCNRLATRQL